MTSSHHHLSVALSRAVWDKPPNFSVLVLTSIHFEPKSLRGPELYHKVLHPERSELHDKRVKSRRRVEAAPHTPNLRGMPLHGAEVELEILIIDN